MNNFDLHLDYLLRVIQVSTLLYCMGKEDEDVLSSTNITTEEIKTYETVLNKPNDYYKVRKNVILETARFNRRSQLQVESAEKIHHCPLQIG